MLQPKQIIESDYINLIDLIVLRFDLIHVTATRNWPYLTFRVNEWQAILGLHLSILLSSTSESKFSFKNIVSLKLKWVVLGSVVKKMKVIPSTSRLNKVHDPFVILFWWWYHTSHVPIKRTMLLHAKINMMKCKSWNTILHIPMDSYKYITININISKGTVQ